MVGSDNVLRSHADDFGDQTGKCTRLPLWYTPADDPYGMLSRWASLVDSAAFNLPSQLAPGIECVVTLTAKINEVLNSNLSGVLLYDPDF